MDRRQFLTASAALAAAPNAAASMQDVRDFSAPLAPVLSRPERVVRTVVGLRPYRKTGFVIRREDAGRRTLIHNYGHGGCGVTLSWGCAELAVARAADVKTRRAAVIGAGVIGLTTALMLLRRGYDVTVYAEDLPPHTTSNIAAAFWMPTTLFRRSLVDDAFLNAFRLAARLSQRAFQHYVNDPGYGVRWIRYYQFSDQVRQSAADPAYEGDDLYPGKRVVTDDAPFGFAQTTMMHSLMIDPDIFLRRLMHDIGIAGGRIFRRRFESREAVFDLKERLIFNCTGLGAKALFGDDALEPARGQLTLLLPQPEIDYGYVYPTTDGLLYMFPRKGAIVLGGTVEDGIWSLAPDDADRTRMLAGHAAMAERIS
ncbi:MAG: FAD-dependent oxidoreductase [Hyphococcus sp.]